MSFKRKAHDEEMRGIISSKKAKIPVTKTVSILSDKAGNADHRIWEPPKDVSTKDFCWTAGFTPLTLRERSRESIVAGKDYISLPVHKLIPSPSKSPSKSPPRSPWFYISSIRDGDSPYDDDIFTRFQKRTKNFATVVLRPLEISSSSDLEELELQSVKAYESDMSNHVFFRLENEIRYFDGQVSKRRLPFIGLSFKLPRKHVAYGDAGLTFTFDGATVDAKPWIPLLEQLKGIVNRINNVQYNFVLIHRFKNGLQHLNESKNIEHFRDSDHDSRLCFLLLGHARTMAIRREKMPKKRGFFITMETGSLLVASPIFFNSWTYAFPSDKSITNPTIILQFIKKVLSAPE